MSKKSLTDRIKVKDPCMQDWETMRGNNTVRFCDHCSKSVNNLSEMTRKEAVRMIRAAGANICIRYIKDPANGRPMFADQLIQISRRAPRLVASVMSASMSLATMAYAQGSAKGADPKTPSVERIQSPVGDKEQPKTADTSKSERSISGTVVDPNGAVIPGAKVILGGAIDSRSVTSNEEGKYKFDNVADGNYLIQTEAPGFRVQTTRILIANGEETKHDVGLEVGVIEVSVDIPLETAMEVAVAGGMMIAEYSTELNQAVSGDDIDRVKELIVRGANVNGKDDGYSKVTPLFIAVGNGNVEIARLLLESGAKVNVRDAERQTPIMRLDDDSDAAMVELLIQHGAKIDLEDKEGNTALILAAENAAAEVIDALIKAGAEVNAANDEGQTALMNAAYADDVETVRLLLIAGADVNAKNREGETAWDQTSDEKVEELLVAHGAKVGAKERSGDKTYEEPVVAEQPAVN